MRTENEVKLKLSYWQGAFDTLNTPENARANKFTTEKLTAQTWLAALDWMIGQSDESSVKTSEDKK